METTILEFVLVGVTPLRKEKALFSTDLMRGLRQKLMTIMRQEATIPAQRPDDLDVLSTDDAQLVAQFFQVLSDPTRVRLVKALADGKWCVSDLAQALEMDQPAISHQLKYLRRLGLVEWKKRGRHVYYTLDNSLLKTTLLKTLAELHTLAKN